MTVARYEVVQEGSGWIIRHDGDVSPSYDMPEAAFEATLAAASLSVRNGHDVMISLCQGHADEASTGIGVSTGNLDVHGSAEARPPE